MLSGYYWKAFTIAKGYPRHILIEVQAGLI